MQTRTPFAGQAAMQTPVSAAADAQAAIRGVKSVIVCRDKGGSLLITADFTAKRPQGFVCNHF